MTELERRRRIQALGQHAVRYYVDTGLCVFCAADDCTDTPHDDWCDVGALSGVTLDSERQKEKADQRAIADAFIRAEGPA